MKCIEDIFHAVKEGARPALPDSSAPDGYSELLNMCWSGDSHDRPIVDTVHSKITDMFDSAKAAQPVRGATHVRLRVVSHEEEPGICQSEGASKDGKLGRIHFAGIEMAIKGWPTA